MKIQIMSDLHFEFHRDGGDSFFVSLPEPEAEVMVLAGDIIPVASSDEDLGKVFGYFCQRYEQVYFVPGNHEYYGSRAAEAHERLLALPEIPECRGIKVLHPGLMPERGGFRFLGDTMWFPRPDAQVPKRYMNDFRAIRNFEPWVYEQHARGAAFLNENLRPNDIVVTHHMPSYRSVPPRFAASPLNPFFVCDMEELITERQPVLWIHGHTHSSCDYKLGETRVVANPLGYPREASGFKECFVVEI